MLVDVTFDVFAPTVEWLRGFEEAEYKVENMPKQLGIPHISSQEKDVKIRPGIYLTGMNPEMGMSDANFNLLPSYAPSYDRAHDAWRYRSEKGLPFVSVGLIAMMYNLGMYGSLHHVDHGVCDNEQQILDKWPYLQESSQRHFITMTPIIKSEEPERDGWRWHKWGEYIGNHTMECEYLYDEKDVQQVYVFRIHTLANDWPSKFPS